ncbi:MAG: hypothetical protein UW78_C0025G0007 [Candidatus Azambacteria bacterium GW2011_GWA1_44_9]|uniref:Uncharacterized protein n=1 Tax=Candidatus Azambacteria bacterium GW2011_GWA1_44_9 TaxID=1618610 RepID=A0A0G1MIX8_9BACT|nr:MAG: hypothetical protein UW78_C0025G0007 [Candidatus Azambacteria bacterium GW2011_GWA1_44_9]
MQVGAERTYPADDIHPELKKIADRIEEVPFPIREALMRFLADLQLLIISQHKHVARGNKGVVLYDGQAEFYLRRFEEVISSGLFDPNASPKKEIR